MSDVYLIGRATFSLELGGHVMHEVLQSTKYGWIK